MNSVFSEQILADKLSKLNSTQQCIETLSHWCIFHRSKAELVVTTWDKQFHQSEMAQKVPLLYLANDILQNSKRKGNEFVTEFWKVLPAALKEVAEDGDDRGKNAVKRLVDIWEERRVFGSRSQSLQDLMLGEKVPPPLELNKKRSRPVRIVKRDSRSIRTKLSIGSTAEKIVSAFHLVLTEHPNEDLEMSNCKSAVHRVRKMEKDFDTACADAKDPKRKALAKELKTEEDSLKQCIEKLKSVEATRAALVSQLKEALSEQESLLENVRTQMQVAQAQTEEAESMRKRLDDENYITSSGQSTDSNGRPEQTAKKTAAAIAAEVADKLAASSSSQLIMTSVLSSFAAEAAKSAGLTKSLASTNSSADNPGSIPEPGTFIPAPPLTGPSSNSYQSVILPQQTLQSQANPASQPQYHVVPTQPALAPAPSPQYLQPSGGGMMAPFGFSNFPALSAPHPPPPHLVGPVMTQQQPLPLLQQPPPPVPASFRPLQPPGMLFYSGLHPSH